MAGKKGNLPSYTSNLPVVVEPRGRGRPKGTYTMYVPEIVDEIIERMSWGETLTSICRERPDGTARVKGEFPTPWTVSGWANPTDKEFRPEFAPKYAAARLEQQQRWVDDCYDIANTPAPGLEEIRDYSSKNGVSIRRATKDMLGHRVLQIETRLKVLKLINPQLWAEHLQQPAPPPDDPASTGNRVIVEGGLPDNEPPPPAPGEQPDDPASGAPPLG